MDFKSIYEKHKHAVFRICLDFTQQPADAEELTQDVFVKVYYRFHQFNADASLKTWICRIAVRTCLDYLAAKKRKKRFANLVRMVLMKDIDAELPVVHPDQRFDRQEQLQRLHFRIQQLPDRQKSAFILCRVEGYSQAEAAEIMDLSVKAIDALIQRATVTLKKMSAGEGF